MVNGATEKGREAHIASERRVFFHRDRNPGGEVGRRLLADGIHLLEDRVLYNLVGVSLADCSECCGVCLGQTYLIAVHVAHTQMGLRATGLAGRRRLQE